MSRPEPLGHTTWTFPGGNIPAESTGHEPERTSRDELCLLNTSPETAEIELTVFHADRDPVGPYPFTVAGRRVRHVRVNDLINPQAVPLGEPYGIVLHSSVPVVVQLTRLDTRDGQLSTAMTPGLAID